MFTGKLNTMSLHPHHPSRNISNSISLVFKWQSRITFPTKVCERRRRRVHLNLIFTPNFPIELHPSVASIGGQTNIVSHCRGGGSFTLRGGGESRLIKPKNILWIKLLVAAGSGISATQKSIVLHLDEESVVRKFPSLGSVTIRFLVEWFIQ